MVDTTLADEILVIVKDEINKIPVNRRCEVVKSYEGNMVDVQTNEGDIIKYLPCIGDNTVGINAIITHLNKDNNQPIVISDNSGFNNSLLKLIGDICDYVNR